MAEKILIVEDEQNIAELLRLYLEREGLETVIANDGERGVAEFERVRPDLVLLDIMLPGLDGWGVLRKIRAQADTPTTT